MLNVQQYTRSEFHEEEGFDEDHVVFFFFPFSPSKAFLFLLW